MVYLHFKLCSIFAAHFLQEFYCQRKVEDIFSTKCLIWVNLPLRLCLSSHLCAADLQSTTQMGKANFKVRKIALLALVVAPPQKSGPRSLQPCCEAVLAHRGAMSWKPMSACQISPSYNDNMLMCSKYNVYYGHHLSFACCNNCNQKV